MRKKVLINAGITLLLFIVLFTKIDPSEVLGILSSIHLSYFVMALFFIPMLYVIRTYKWGILLDSKKINNSFVNLLRILIIGVFYGLLTPGRLGELGRAYHLDAKISITIPTILIEKIIDVAILILLSLLPIILYLNNSTFKYVILACTAMLLLGTWSMTNRSIISIIAKIFRIGEENVNMYIDNFLELIKDKRTLAKATILTIFYYIIAYISAFLLLLSLDVNPIVVFTLPLIILMGNIPITVSGLGLRESVATICFISLGISGSYGFSFSILLFLTINLIPGIFGYFLRITEG